MARLSDYPYGGRHLRAVLLRRSHKIGHLAPCSGNGSSGEPVTALCGREGQANAMTVNRVCTQCYAVAWPDGPVRPDRDRVPA